MVDRPEYEEPLPGTDPEDEEVPLDEENPFDHESVPIPPKDA